MYMYIYAQYIYNAYNIIEAKYGAESFHGGHINCFFWKYFYGCLKIQVYGFYIDTIMKNIIQSIQWNLSKATAHGPQ